MNQTPSTEILDKEARFHDAWATSTNLDSIAITACFEAITAQENRFIMSILGDLQGRSVADIGCGLGESSLYFAMKGANVTAIDLSKEMIDLTVRNAHEHRLEVTGLVASGEGLDLAPDSFDVVYAANVIHHITDRPKFYANARAALKPGGMFVAWDPLRYNPVINVYRRLATEVRTEDESPLGFDDVKISQEYFPDLKHKEFWCCTLALFLKYYAINRYDVNKVRYWKRILDETDKTIGWWFNPLKTLDSVLLSLPLARRLAWNVVQWGTKPL